MVNNERISAESMDKFFMAYCVIGAGVFIWQ